MSSPSISKYGTTEDFLFQVGRGQVHEHVHEFKFGFNDAVGATAETVWAQGGLYTWPTAAATLEVTSTDDTDDNAAGTGALTVTIWGLDANYAAISETVTMNGNTVNAGCTTTNLFLRVNRMRVATAGSSGTNAGTIYAANSSGTHSSGVPTDLTKVYATIAAGEGGTLQAFYTVEADHTAEVIEVAASSADGSNASTITFRTRTQGGPWITRDKFVVKASSVLVPHVCPLDIEEKSDIEIIATGNASPTDVSATFDMVIVKN